MGNRIRDWTCLYFGYSYHTYKLPLNFAMSLRYDCRGRRIKGYYGSAPAKRFIPAVSHVYCISCMDLSGEYFCFTCRNKGGVTVIGTYKY